MYHIYLGQKVLLNLCPAFRSRNCPYWPRHSYEKQVKPSTREENRQYNF